MLIVELGLLLMPDKPNALSTIPSQPPAEGDYDAICTTVMGSAQGRWFLDEYARRSRNIDTQLVLAAIERIEAAIRGEHGPQGYQSVRADLLDMAKAIAQTRTEAAAIEPEAGAPGKSAGAPASSTILTAAEHIQDVAWTMRERGLDPKICEQIEALVSSILSASSLRNSDDHRTGKLTEVLQYLDRRINALLESCAGEARSSIEQAPTAHASIAEDAPAGPAGHPAPGGNGFCESASELVVPAHDDGAAACATQSTPDPILPPALSDDVPELVEAPAQPHSQELECEPAAADPIASEPSLETIQPGDGRDLEADEIAPSPEVASQLPGPTPLPVVEFQSTHLGSEPAATPEGPPADTETIPEPRREPSAASQTIVLELDPLVVVPAGPRETSADAQPMQLEHDPIVVEPLFGAATSAPPPERVPFAPPRAETPEEPQAVEMPEEAASGPSFRPPEVAMVFLVEGAGPAGDDEPVKEDEPAQPTASEAPPAEIAEVLIEPLPVPSGSPAQPAGAPAPRPGVASPSDPLVALKTMSEEERIALFT